MMDDKAKPMCTGEVGIFAGKVKCMYCGYTLRSRKNRDFKYLSCTSRFFSDQTCKGTFVAQRFLEKAVLDELNAIISQFFDEEAAEEHLSICKRYELQKKKLQKEAAGYQKKVDELENAIKNLYLDKTKDIITEQEFLNFRKEFQYDISEYKDKLSASNRQLELLMQELDEEHSTKSILQKYRNVEKLDRAIVDALIDYIEIGRNDHKVHRADLPPMIIHWKF